MDALTDKIDELVGIMEEFGLDSAKLSGEDWSVKFSRETGVSATTSGEPIPLRPVQPAKSATGSAPSGTPVNSPTTGIFYSSPNPGAAPFVKEGDAIEAGQVIGLIEAMKVFNEITATVSGIVRRVVAENGQLVQPGDPLLYIG